MVTVTSNNLDEHSVERNNQHTVQPWPADHAGVVAYNAPYPTDADATGYVTESEMRVSVFDLGGFSHAASVWA